MHWQQTNKINKEKMIRYLNVRWSPCTLLGCLGIYSERGVDEALGLDLKKLRVNKW